jgi:hypothetical protein
LGSSATGKEREREREKLGDVRRQRESLPPNLSHVDTPTQSPMGNGNGNGSSCLPPAIIEGGGSGLCGVDESEDRADSLKKSVGGGVFGAADTAELEARLASLERTWQAAMCERAAERATVHASWSVASVSEAPHSAYSPPQVLPASLLTTPAFAVACRVVGVAMALDNRGRSFTKYRLVVLLAHGGTLEVARRFSDFVKLHLKLTALFPHLPLPKVANSLFSGRGSWFNRFDPDLIERRQVWLEEYLMALIRMQQCEACPPLRSFLAGVGDVSFADGRCVSVAYTADTWLATSNGSQFTPPPVPACVTDSTTTSLSQSEPPV